MYTLEAKYVDMFHKPMYNERVELWGLIVVDSTSTNNFDCEIKLEIVSSG